MDHLFQTLLVFALPVLFAITIHEAAHGYAARHFGDNTAYVMGRVTLNPFKHIDLFGTIILPILTFFGTPIMVGYAKPVPVNFGHLRHPKRDMIWVALAGPGSNLVQALLWALLYALLDAAGIQEPFFVLMATAGVYFNFIMAAFNLFPLPPLDGGRVLVGLLPYRQAVAVSSLERWGFFIVLALFYFGIVSKYWMWPLLRVCYSALDLLQLSTPIPRF